jgi:hypothetical protein
MIDLSRVVVGLAEKGGRDYFVLINPYWTLMYISSIGESGKMMEG